MMALFFKFQISWNYSSTPCGNFTSTSYLAAWNTRNKTIWNRQYKNTIIKSFSITSVISALHKRARYFWRRPFGAELFWCRDILAPVQRRTNVCNENGTQRSSNEKNGKKFKNMDKT